MAEKKATKKRTYKKKKTPAVKAPVAEQTEELINMIDEEPEATVEVVEEVAEETVIEPVIEPVIEEPVDPQVRSDSERRRRYAALN